MKACEKCLDECHAMDYSRQVDGCPCHCHSEEERSKESDIKSSVDWSNFGDW